MPLIKSMTPKALKANIKAEIEAGKPVKMIRKKIGEAAVLKVFDIKNLGVIAGAYVRSGKFSKDAVPINSINF